ncbi:MAG: PP2C family protein-serine/threonine phosphatase [Candidatus Latescibacterota bacterium]
MAGKGNKHENGAWSAAGGLSVLDLALQWFASWRMMLSPLAGDVRRFAKWLESDALPSAGKAGERSLRLEITADSVIHPLSTDDNFPDHRDGFRQLGTFFLQLGIKRMELDPRLEQNQIEDLVVFLAAHKKSIRSRTESGPAGGAAGKLRSPEGAQLSCMQLQLMDDWLHVSYHYCLTSFSRIVLWFEDRNHHFGDHRALFQSASRYGLLAAVVALVPLGIYLANGSRPILLVVSLLASLTLFGMVYLFFMIVGSLEYDNEEKAYRLNLANRDLTAYARTIQDDLRRAKSIQEKLLPDRSNMPLRGRVNWATAFFPETAIGGDYFDAIEIDTDKVAILFADVSGHGMSAAFITAILKATFQSWVEDQKSLDEFISRLNGRLYDLTPEDSFAAVFAAIFDHGRGELCYFNGGHSPEPIMIPANMSLHPFYLSGAPGMILGIVEDLPVTLGYQKLAAGDKILLATDGITEAENMEGGMYGGKRLESLLQQLRYAPIGDLVDGIIGDVDRFAAGAIPDDDRTILAFEVNAVTAQAAV